MEFIIENWYLFVIGAAMGIAAFVAIKHFWGLPTNEQLDKIRGWLLSAVIEAERALGSGTGEAKMSLVYKTFVKELPWLAMIVSYDTFKALAEIAVARMKVLLTEKPQIAALVQKDVA